MELLGRDLTIFSFLLLSQILWFPTAGLLYHCYVYNAELSEIKSFLKHTRFLEVFYSFEKGGFNLLGLSTTNSLNRFLSIDILLKSLGFFLMALLSFVLAILGAVSGIVRNYGTPIMYFYVAFIFMDTLLAIRFLLFGRKLKMFVKHKQKS